MVHLEPHRASDYHESSLSSYDFVQTPQGGLQSDEAETVLSGSAVTGNTDTAVVEFLDEVPGSSWSVEHPVCTNLADKQPEIELANYLSRPVLIKTHVWAQTDSYNTTTTWDPWYLFFNSTPIKNKVNNYSFINCTLKLKFVINASPFYSGAMAFCYSPLQNLNGNSLIADAGGGELLGYSQRPKVWIYPQTCQGGELTLPFFYHKNWLDLTSAQALKDMGTITPALFAQLVSATGVTGTSVVVNVYAWAENVKLHAPTTKLALQVDEFDYKPSQIASSVSAASKALSRIPLIGPYMKAASTVSSGLSKIASSLGFTNVPVVDPVPAVKLQPYPQNSTCEVSVYADRSSVDPKNEVTLDPRTVGLDGTDELDISYISAREAFIGNAILSSTDTVDTLTLVSRVTPALCYQLNNLTPMQYTPMGYMCNLFKYWRGDIIFRFKFICTRFHKGRVRITFDPTNDISTTVPDYTTVFNEVVDIGAEQDVEVRVPYSQATTFLETSLISGNYNFSGSSLAPNSTSNGLITMRVVNPLSGPVANTAIPVMVFVRAADNIEFAHPTTQITPANTISTYGLQSGNIEYPVAPVQVIAGNKATTGDPNKYHVHFGESIPTLRMLIHRLAHQYTLDTNNAPALNSLTIINHKTSRRLKYGGWDPAGPFTANKALTVGTAPYSYVRMNVHQLISLLFVGQRGSITHSFNIEGGWGSTAPPARVSLQRYDGSISTAEFNSVNTLVSNTVNTAAYTYQTSTYEFNNGTALTDQRGQPGIVMNFPYYSNYNFQLVRPVSAFLGTTIDGTSTDNIILSLSTAKPSSTSSFKINAWSAYGPDYNFFFFLNTPSLYTLAIPTGV